MSGLAKFIKNNYFLVIITPMIGVGFLAWYKQQNNGFTKTTSEVQLYDLHPWSIKTADKDK